MCKNCEKMAKLRDTPLDENELALFQRLKDINDTSKLAARLPAWIKTHNRLVAAPKQFEFKRNQAPVYPSWTNRPTTVSWVDADRQIPGASPSTPMSDYVRRFESLNNLKAAA